MTSNSKKERAALSQLEKALVDDILKASDEDILAEFKDAFGDPERNVAETRSLFEKSLMAANKRRLVAARAGLVAARRQDTSKQTSAPIDIRAARERLRKLVDRKDVPPGVTIAARKETELSDSDVLGMLEDFKELGIVSGDDDDDGHA